MSHPIKSRLEAERREAASIIDERKKKKKLRVYLFCKTKLLSKTKALRRRGTNSSCSCKHNQKLHTHTHTHIPISVRTFIPFPEVRVHPLGTKWSLKNLEPSQVLEPRWFNNQENLRNVPGPQISEERGGSFHPSLTLQWGSGCRSRLPPPQVSVVVPVVRMW